jgi:hypothetical protein
MARQRITDKLARKMLADQGVRIIWKLHEDAATLYWVGNSVAADTFVKIADAAEREWLRQQSAPLTVW